MSNDPFSDAMDSAEAQQEADEPDEDYSDEVAEFLDSLDRDGARHETIGIGVTPEMNAVWKELQKPAEKGGTDVDVIQSVRDQMVKFAQRNPDTVERAMRKYKIDNEY